MSTKASPLPKSIKTQPRLDLRYDVLFKLSLFSIYLSSSPTVVASVLNQRLSPKPRVTTEDVIVTYLYLHDNEHPSWVKARDMNRSEKELLRALLGEEGLEKALLEVRIIQPVGPIGCLRTTYLRESLDRHLDLDG
jgi:hypothetical protein